MNFDKEILFAAAHSRYVTELRKIDLFVNFYYGHKTDKKHNGMDIFDIGGVEYLLISFDTVFNYTMIFSPIKHGEPHTFKASPKKYNHEKLHSYFK